MLRLLLPLFLVSSLLGQETDPAPLVQKVIVAVGGEGKLLKIFRIEEIFHFGVAAK